MLSIVSVSLSKGEAIYTINVILYYPIQTCKGLFSKQNSSQGDRYISSAGVSSLDCFFFVFFFLFSLFFLCFLSYLYGIFFTVLHNRPFLFFFKNVPCNIIYMVILGQKRKFYILISSNMS